MKSKVKMAVMAMLLLAAGTTVMYATTKPEPMIMEYRVTAESGDTVWSICRRIATDRDDLSRVVWQAMRDSHISDASDLQPGQVVIVRVQSVD